MEVGRPKQESNILLSPSGFQLPASGFKLLLF